MKRRLLLASIGGDPHQQGLFRAARLADRAGFATRILSPGVSDDELCRAAQQLEPTHVGLSYRLGAERGVAELERVVELLGRSALGAEVRLAFAGLEATTSRVRARFGRRVWVLPQHDSPLDSTRDLLGFLGLDATEREPLLAWSDAELAAPRIAALDQLADEIVAAGDFRDEPPLPVPTRDARRSLVRRIEESPFPLLRAHFGVPAPTIEPTVEGIRTLASSRALDEISLGSSDLSQRYFGHPTAFAVRPNDGGVPYRDEADLRALVQAAQRGNHPALKPYAHVVDLVAFVRTCLRVGMLAGGHQAVPLFWFNELDGRGPTRLGPSLVEHVAAIDELVRHGIPVEINDPNQWASRWAHDVVFCASYALLAAVLARAGAATSSCRCSSASRARQAISPISPR